MAGNCSFFHVVFEHAQNHRKTGCFCKPNQPDHQFHQISCFINQFWISCFNQLFFGTISWSQPFFCLRICFEALNLAQNFSQCLGPDTANLRETWQRAMRSEERSKEALVDAWSATVTTAERLALAFEEKLGEHFGGCFLTFE